MPADEALNRILRYEASIQRQLVHATNQLERLQRARKGEHVSVPLSVQVSSDQQHSAGGETSTFVLLKVIAAIRG